MADTLFTQNHQSADSGRHRLRRRVVSRVQGRESAGAGAYPAGAQEADRHAVECAAQDQALLGHLLLAAGKIARELKIDGAFRLVINNGQEGGQAVFHVHMHILAGRKFRWPPG